MGRLIKLLTAHRNKYSEGTGPTSRLIAIYITLRFLIFFSIILKTGFLNSDVSLYYIVISLILAIYSRTDYILFPLLDASFYHHAVACKIHVEHTRISYCHRQ